MKFIEGGALRVTGIPGKFATIATVEEWMRREGLPDDWMGEKKQEKRDAHARLFHALQERLWEEHLKTLGWKERMSLQMGRHPSQNQNRYSKSLPYAAALKKDLDLRCDFVQNVEPDIVHATRIVLAVNPAFDVGRETIHKTLPFHYRGFRIKAVPFILEA